MNRSAKRQQHEQARKRHKHEQQQHARELARRPRASFPRWLLIGSVALILVFVLGIAVAR
jgi:hypothetical protein